MTLEQIIMDDSSLSLSLSSLSSSFCRRAPIRSSPRHHQLGLMKQLPNLLHLSNRSIRSSAGKASCNKVDQSDTMPRRRGAVSLHTQAPSSTPGHHSAEDFVFRIQYHFVQERPGPASTRSMSTHRETSFYHNGRKVIRSQSISGSWHSESVGAFHFVCDAITIVVAFLYALSMCLLLLGQEVRRKVQHSENNDFTKISRAH